LWTTANATADYVQEVEAVNWRAALTSVLLGVPGTYPLTRAKVFNFLGFKEPVHHTVTKESWKEFWSAYSPSHGDLFWGGYGQGIEDKQSRCSEWWRLASAPKGNEPVTLVNEPNSGKNGREDRWFDRQEIGDGVQIWVAEPYAK
jgi:hypothetical protein